MISLGGLGRPALLALLLALGAACTLAVSASCAAADLAADSRGAAVDSIRSLLDDGRYAEAETAARSLLERAEREHGPESQAAGNAIDVLVEALWRSGKTSDSSTLALAERGVALDERLGGPNAPSLWESLDNLATVRRERGEFAQARPLLERALAICERAFGEDDGRTAIVLNSLGIILTHAGESEAALAAHDRALRIREALFGPDAFMVSQSLHSLGTLHMEMDRYAPARAMLERAMRIREAELGPIHRELAATIVNLAVVEYMTGAYPEARSLLERAATILEAALGPDHPDVSTAYNNLGAVLAEMGEFPASLRAFEKALAIAEAREGKDHLLPGGQRANLGILAWTMGDAAAAERELGRALAAFEGKDLGPYINDAALAMTALGKVYAARGAIDSALAIDERAVALAESGLGATDVSVAIVLEDYADVVERGGDRARAVTLVERARTIKEAAQGPEHPALAGTMQRLARLAWDSGDGTRARLLQAEALRISVAALGGSNPASAEAEATLAHYLAASGDTTRALEAALRAEESMRDHLRLTSAGLSERQALAYASQRVSSLDLALQIGAAENVPGSAQRSAWDAGVRSRALVLDEMASRARTVAGAGDSDVARLAGEFAAASRRLANLAVRGLGPHAPDAYRSLLDEARREREDAERSLAERSAAFRREESARSAGLEDALAALPPKSALVSFFRTDREARFGGSSYVAFAAHEGGARAFSLGDAREIDRAVSSWLAQIHRGMAVSLEPPSQAAASEEVCREAGAELRRRVWDPLAASLAGAERVFIVPDGALSLINIAALPDERGGYVVESAPIVHVLSAERDLVAGAAAPPAVATLLALGGPDFDATAAEPLEFRGASRDAAAFRGQRPECASFDRVRFERLPGAEQEAHEIAALWAECAAASDPGRAGGTASAAVRPATRIIELTGRDATEAELKRTARECSVLHLATHGYFLGEECRSASSRSRGIGAMAPSPSQDAHDTGSHAAASPAAASNRGENPLRLSGLALAGANQRASASPDEEDGMLTAEEIAALDLSGVSWCVLSACETGVGDLWAGEGVLGLRRAVQVAGARTLITSLWAVKDEPTRAWMRALYEARLRRRLDTAAAVQAASRSVLAERRARGESTHPFLWAAFVACGDWR